MSSFEEAIWQRLYTAAFLDELRDLMKRSISLEQALDATVGNGAVSVANRGVLELRRNGVEA